MSAMFKAWAQKPINGARELQARVHEAASSGTASVRSMLGTLPFCASLTSTAQPQDGEADEDLIHYFLIPCGLDDSGYTLFSKRQLPIGIGTENALPKFSVFHLPHEGAERKLEALVLGQLSSGLIDAAVDVDEPLDKRLERIAGEIEKYSNQITMGILVIGGIAAVANPLLGVAIAANALMPSVGSLVSSEAMKLSGNKLRKWRERGDQKRTEKQAKAELSERKTRLVVNPYLANLQKAIDTSEGAFDPSMEDPFLHNAEGFTEGSRGVTIEILAEYYTQIESITDDSSIGPEDRRWLNMIYRYAKSTP